MPKPASKGFGKGEFVDELIEDSLLPESVDVADDVSVADAAVAFELAPEAFWTADDVALAFSELVEEPRSSCRT